MINQHCVRTDHSSDPIQHPISSMGEEDESATPAPRMITIEELSTHSTPGDLWVSIQGNVYDVSKWASIHPGGDLAIQSFAGQPDATDAFLAFHPKRAFDILPKFHIGKLADYNPHELTIDHARVLHHLSQAGLLEVRLRDYARLLAILLLMFSLVVSGVVLSPSPWIHAVCAILLGGIWIQAGFIGHDLGHTGMTGDKRLDSILGVVIGNCVSGIGFAWWKRNHNAHHFSCNSLEYDPDLQYIPLFAVSSRFFSSLHSYFYKRKMPFDGVARFLVSYQHWTFYLVMAVARINLYAQSFIVAIWGERVRSRGLELGSLLFFWTWMICLLSYLPTNSERVGFVLLALATTGVQHVQFCLNHFSSPVYQSRPEGDHRWVQAQATGTLNLGCSKGWDWFHGGLHFQVEHHLFPKIPRLKLREASERFVRPMLVDKHKLPYVSVSFWEANVMIVRTLRAAAMEARDLTKPVRNMLWEAVNAHG